MTQPQRLKRERTKGWRKPDNCVIVDRTSKWGNPFKVSECREAGFKGTDAELAARCVSAFSVWLGPLWRNNWNGKESEAARTAILDNLSDLRGKNLVCWCELDQPCHADVLLELANAPDQRAIVAHPKGGA